MTVEWRTTLRRAATAAILQDLLLTVLALTVDLGVLGHDRKLRDDWGQVPERVLPAATVLVLITLLLRRRCPVVVLSVQAGFAMLLSALVPNAGIYAGVLVALYAVASRRGPMWSALGLFVATAVVNVQLVSKAVEVHSFDGAWLLSLFSGLLTLAVWAAGYRARVSQARLTALTADHQTARAAAIRDERLRIARDLHDIVAGSVSVMVVQAAGAQAVVRSDLSRAETALDVIQRTGTQAMTELRRLLGLLRSAGDQPAHELGPQPGLDGVDELLESLRATGLTITFRLSGTPAPIDASVSLACYRVVQESLTNTIKYAGLDSAAEIHLAWSTDRLVLEVSDRGPHAPADARLSTGHGLLGLHERVTTLGGTFAAGPDGPGFLVRAELPVAADRRPAPTGVPQRR